MKFSASLLVPAGVVIASVVLGTILGSPENPPLDPAKTIEAHVAMPQNVRRILRKSCYDCHSNETHWPWYAGIPGVSRLVQGDVKRARTHLNLSDWSSKLAEGPDEAQASLNGICEELRSDSMPIAHYRWIHRNVALSPSEVNTVCSWTLTAQKP